jgi:hypothetical protein
MTILLKRSLANPVGILAIVIVATAAGPGAQTDDPTTVAAVERATRYVVDYLNAFSALVCEEKQVQTLVRPDGHVSKRRELTADFLLVKTGPESMSIFRDVMDVDGRKVRNREDRLRRLFLGPQTKTALEQAKAIASESARYNIGVSRQGNSPLLPLKVLTPRTAPGFHFGLNGTSLSFSEFRSPSLLRRRTQGREFDMMSTGSFAIDPESGRILSAELTATGQPSAVQAWFSVRYEEDAKVTMLVPIEVRERYWSPSRPREDHLEVAATYANFRRFQVTTEEQIKK